MKIVADTDILSIFAKIDRLDILKKLFTSILITQAVQSELKKGNINIKPLNPTLTVLKKEELKALKGSGARLGMGERECFTVAKNRDIPLTSNEKIVHALCKKDGVSYLTLPRILRLAILGEVISREEAKQIIKLIENEENTVIKGKDEIFS
ncbi:MAG: hypothetical protein HYY22_10070 [Thaumarchaeota archaeon]|nr:hypothetical protein [Nitrososphaerota archaeon]